MFKRLNETLRRPRGFLTIRAVDVWLVKEPIRKSKRPVKTLYANLDGNLECITNSKERQEHFKTASYSYLQERLEEWQRPEVTKVKIATPEHPIELMDVSVCLVLKIEGCEYIVSSYRDIFPLGWVAPGGCSKYIYEIFNPRIIAIRELSEESLLSDTRGRVYCFSPSRSDLIEENILKWGLRPTKLVTLPIRELVSSSQGDAENLVIMRGNRRRRTRNIIFIDSEQAIVTAAFYWKVEIPVVLRELQLRDGEKGRENVLLKRPVRLTNREGEEVAFFDQGHRSQSACPSNWNCIKTARVMSAIVK